MPDETYFLMRPISRGFYKATDLLDGSIDLEMVGRCNDTIDMEIENERRFAEHLKRSR